MLAAAAASTPACFGDNSGGTSIRLTAPEELDGGGTVDIVVEIQAETNEQMSVAVDSETGTFSQQSKLVITDSQGAGSFTTRYTADNVTGTATLVANVSGGGASGESVTREVPVFEVERVGNVAPIPETIEEMDYLTAYPLELTASRTLRKLAIVAPAAATALVGLYSNAITIDGDAPGDALARVTATLTAGANEIVVPAQALPAGKYWMVVTYDGKATTARSTSTVIGRSLTAYTFSRGLPDTMPAMTLTSTMGKRNFYIVLRK